MPRKRTLALTLTAAAFGTAALWPQSIVSLLQMLFPSVLWRADTTERVIALTFDDGPDPIFTPQVLRVLQDAHIKATFFLVGERARRFPSVVEAIRNAGHAIGNHTDSWRRTLALDANEFEQDLLRAERTLAITAPKFFRPAGGMLRPDHMRILKEHGYSVVLGSAYAFDPYRPPPNVIHWVIGRGIRPGATIVLHDSGGDRSNSVAALPSIIQKAKNAGFCFATLPQLLGETRRLAA